MGGLGNGRRVGRSPPLMIGALIACILVLGFNYWVSSSRNLELQTKLYELEGQVRRGAAERGAAEMKKNEFQEEIQRQKAQITHIESLYKRQLEGAQNTCSQDKGTLHQNISSTTKTIQELKVQLNQMNDDLGKVQKELQSCQSNVVTLNNKLTYDMTHCNSQVLSQKELCEERVAAAKLEVQKKMEKLNPPAGAQDTADKEDAAVVPESDSGKAAAVVSTQGLSQPKENEPPELLTNEIIVGQDLGDPVDLPLVKDVPQKESHTLPSTAPVKQEVTLPPEGAPRKEENEAKKPLKKNLTEFGAMDAQEDGTHAEAEPGMEDILVGQGKGDETLEGQKLEEPEDYDHDEQVGGRVDLEKEPQNKQPENTDKDMEDELADYNGDEDNEGEFEADKQAELAQV
ncbi:Golgi membrane protein 1 isoform 3-T3 [Aulostomus maculatus]